MSRELARTKEALKHALNGLAFAGRTSTIAEVEAVLNPAPAMEEVEETVGWVNVWQDKSGNVRLGSTFSDQESADRSVLGCGGTRIACQEIKVKVMRPVPVKVERSVRLDISANGVWTWPDGAPQHTGHMYGTFIYTEEPA